MGSGNREPWDNPTIEWTIAFANLYPDEQRIRGLPHTEELQLFLEFRRDRHDYAGYDDHHFAILLAMNYASTRLWRLTAWSASCDVNAGCCFVTRTPTERLFIAGISTFSAACITGRISNHEIYDAMTTFPLMMATAFMGYVRQVR